jgi:hypothetical protein
MIAVITGDIINSQREEVGSWLNSLKETLSHYGTSPQDWEVYRGDSFQLKLKPRNAFLASIHIKAKMKQTFGLDVRMAIGIGQQSYISEKVLDSNGEAFVNSGVCFENLGKQTLALKSSNMEEDERINIMLRLATHIANGWSKTVAETIEWSIVNPDLTQKELAEKLNKSQSSISEALKRGAFDELMEINNYYINLLKTL